MSFKLKKDHLTNWNATKPNDRTFANDDQDTYISEQTTDITLPERSQSPVSNRKQHPLPPLSPTPPPSPPIANQTKPKKKRHTLRYSYNELPSNGVPLAVQYDNAKKDEVAKQKAIRKAPPGKGRLAEVPHETSPETSNFYPYAQTYQLQNPNRIKRYQQMNDGQSIPPDSEDPSKNISQPEPTDLSSARTQRHRKKHRGTLKAPLMKYNPDRLRYEIVPESSSSPTAKQRVPSQDINNNGYTDHPSRRTDSQRRSESTENKDPSTSEKTSNRSGINSDTSSHRSRHHHHHHRHHHSPTQSQKPDPSSIESTSEKHSHHHHHHHHHHNEHRSAYTEFVGKEFHIIDASFKKSQRAPFFQTKVDTSQLPPPVVYNSSLYLPPIIREYQNTPKPVDNHGTPKPLDYYGVSTFSRDWNDSTKSPEVYKPGSETKFYDRYLNSVIEKRLTIR